MKRISSNTPRRRPCLLGSALLAAALPMGLPAADADVDALERRVEQLADQLEQARRELAAARDAAADANARAEQAEAELAAADPPAAAPVRIGPVTIGGAIRANYVLGSYTGVGGGPSRGGHGGNVELDTFRINLSLDHEQLTGKLEYRWYDGYNFLHTGWLGYAIDDASQVQVGVTRVPFGPGPYGVSQSWFFDQHYYVGLSDDMDLGIKYVTRQGNWKLDFAYFARSEGEWRGDSKDSARYSYDAVKWTSGAQADGTVVAAPVNGFEERNQFNVRAIYSLSGGAVPTDLGVSLQYGELRGTGTDDGDHWAASLHMVNRFGNFTLASQLTRYQIDISANNPWGRDDLIPMGAYDFAWPVATEAWIPAVSLSYQYNTPQIAWLDYILPYVEYSRIVKDSDAFNDSELFTLGAAWAHGGWYIYSDLVFSNGNYFVGNEGDVFSNVLTDAGDFGANGNDQWNHRFNINFGYYF